MAYKQLGLLFVSVIEELYHFQELNNEIFTFAE